MTRRTSREAWIQQAAAAYDQVETFNTGHPHANWMAIETAIDGVLAGLKRDLLAQSIQGHALADFRGATERPRCPHCGRGLHANGQVVRRVVTQGGADVEIERTRGRCPGCGAGGFPPWMKSWSCCRAG